MVNIIPIEIYELLMERMGRIKERGYAILTISDYYILDNIKLLNDYIKLYEYEQAELVLYDIKKYIGDTILDKQFILRAESLIDYRLGKIDANEFLEGCIKAIKLTIPQYKKISLTSWPLSINEAEILLNISTGYAEKGDYISAISILEEINCALQLSYIDEQQKSIINIIVLSNLSKWYGLSNNHVRAIEVAEKGILIARNAGIGSGLSNLLYSIAWNKEVMIKKGLISSDNRKICFDYLKQAYYIASTLQQTFVEQFINEHINKNYNDLNGV